MFIAKPTKPTARVPHRCTWCGETISVGETYSAWGSADEGVWFANKMHLPCLEVSVYEEDNSYVPFENERP